tara:strand:+ start:1200 stop:3779 length:2580 start_codon:yes stop_codon:yes gene_type:complete
MFSARVYAQVSGEFIMCGLCGFGDAGAVSDGNHLSAWPSFAAQRLADLGLEVADAGALFGGAVPLTGPGDEVDETGFNAFFDIPSGTGTPYFLGVGQRINAEISFQGDTDWFAMSLVQGQTYQISLRALPFFGLGDPQLYLFDNFGSFLTLNDNGGSGLDSLLTITATRTGTYFIGATGFGGNGQSTGQYEISLAQVNFTADIIGDIAATAGVVAVDGFVTGTIDYGTDQDWYGVSVEKGKTYAVFLDSATLSFTPLADPKLEVLDRNQTSVAINDDNGITKNAALTFTADYTGTYFIKAYGGPANTGDFKLTVADFTPPAPPSPTAGLDWGVKFNKTNIKVYFALQGETFANELTDTPWNAYEVTQAMSALREYSKFSNLTFTTVNIASQADFFLTKNFLDSSTTGRMFPQDPEFGGAQGVGWFNTKPSVWSREAGGFLEKGAYGYSNFIHEFGHGLGLSHPHDNGGTSLVFAGVSGSGDFGDDDLNQEVFTVMSYNKGWQTGFNGGSGTNAYGIVRTPMAFDISVIQEKYGANTTHASGNDTYTLWTKNEIGTGYETIWDTGGRDTIVNPGSAGATIDLRAATLKQEPGGGGFVSFTTGIFGGYTIANGVRIENATGGSGRDTLIGNGGRNLLDGGGDKDVMIGGRGNDTYIISQADDVVSETRKGGVDTLRSGAVSLDLNDYDFVENARLTGARALDLTGSKQANLLAGNKAANEIFGSGGGDTLRGSGGSDTLRGAAGNDKLIGQAGRDKLFGGAGNDVIEGGKLNDKLFGNKGADSFVFKGNFGDDTIGDFKKGADALHLSKSLWTGQLTKAQVVSDFADIVRGNVVFEFDGGQSITLKGVGSTAGLADDLVLI